MNTLIHNRKHAFVPAFLFALTLSPLPSTLTPVFAGGSGSTAMQVLKTDISPRAMGMGGSFVAVADDIYAVNYNPAGLAQLYVPEASAMYLSGFDDAKLEYVAIGMPMPFLGLAGIAKPAMAVSAIFSDAGRFNWTTMNGDGSLSSKNLNAQTDSVIALSYGEKVYSGDVNLEGYKAKIEQYAGMSVKFISSDMLQHYSASALAFDAGWLVMEQNIGLTFGAGLANYGGGIKYASETEKLPSILRLGLALQRPTILDQSALVSVEYDSYLAEPKKSLRLGLEYNFEKIFKARLGYKALEDNKGLTLGLGVHYDDLAFDFALSLGNAVFNTSQVALSYKFNGYVNSAYKRKVNYKEPEPARKTVHPAPKAKPQPKKPPPEENKNNSDFFLIN
ncbi:MAG: PorV/PorQ family protein [Elusimicrobia bacterium]|nr:PorV/PorQ family protein [Elusimicrobiota bacterium]